MPSLVFRYSLSGYLIKKNKVSHMNRSLLERSSWIAGIVSAGIAIWVLLFPPSSSEERLASPSLKQEQSSISSHVDISRAMPSAAMPATIEKGSPHVCPEKGSIQNAKKQADDLLSYSAHDEAYNLLIDDALCIGDLKLAIELSSGIFSYGGQDVAYAKVLDMAISAKDMELSERIAAMMNSYNAQDNARRKIINSLRRRD